MSDSVVLPELPTYLTQMNLTGFLSLIITMVLPLVAAFFIKQSWAKPAKFFILVIIAGIKAVLEAWLASTQNHVHFSVGPVLYVTGLNVVLAIVTYVGLLKGTSVQQAAITSGPVKDTPAQ